MKANSVFQDLISGKNVLFVPIVSMRSHETNVYDLTCDGNVQRVITSFLDVDKDTSYITYVIWPGKSLMTPESVKRIEAFQEQVKEHVVNVFLDSYPVGGASVQRSIEGVQAMMSDLVDDYLGPFCEDRINLVIYETNYLGAAFEVLKKAYDYKTCYWCYGSRTIDFNPDYLKKFEYVDQELAKSCDYFMVASKGQYAYFKDVAHVPAEKIVINTNFINPARDCNNWSIDEDIIAMTDKLIEDGYTIIYLPVRLSDPGYHARDVIEACDFVTAKTPLKIALLYSDPNDSNVFDDYREECDPNCHGPLKIIKVSSKKDIYYTMLSQVDCIVPYLEDCTEKFHTSFLEFLWFKTKLIYTRYWSDEGAYAEVDDGIDWSCLDRDNCVVLRSTPWKDIADKIIEVATRPKARLWMIEGFDRTGKDTMLDMIHKDMESEGRLCECVYVQHNYEGDDPQPDYRKTEIYLPWLNRYLRAQANDLVKIALTGKEDVYMTRLFISDFVYSSLFGRPLTAIKFQRYLSRYFTLNVIALSWRSYEEYLERCKKSGDEIEYSEEEWKEVDSLFTSAVLNRNSPVKVDSAILFPLHESDSREEVFKRVKEAINSMKQS